jgi:2-dehydropantoate 2-reductase
MLEDVEARRPTEIDLITGALVREAERTGVEAPLHTALYRLVKAKEASWRVEPTNGHADTRDKEDA